MEYPGFCGGSYVERSTHIDCEDTINFYVAQSESKYARAPFSLMPTPGVETFVESVDGQIRGAHAFDGRAWFVSGRTTYEVTAGQVLTARGTLLIDANLATLTDSGDGGDQIFITSGGEGYILDKTTNTLTPVVANATFGAFLDSFFIRLDANSNTIGVSNAYDGLTWPGVQIAQRQSAPDPWKAMFVANSKIYLIGDETGEVWYNAGTSPIPFAPFQGALIPHGIAAAASIADLSGAVMYLAKTVRGQYQVVRVSGYGTADVVSTAALEAALASYSRVDDARAWTYQELGEDFYILNLPSANISWAYNPKTGWAKRGTWNTTQNRYDAWRPDCHMFAFGKHLVGDRDSGILYRLSADLGFDAGGGPIRRLRTGPPMGIDRRAPGKPRPRIIDRFTVQLEGGRGLITGQGSDPQILFRKSKDGGKTWGNYRSRSAGAIGKYTVEPWWGRVGAALDFVPQIVVSDPIPWCITGADVQVSQAA